MKPQMLKKPRSKGSLKRLLKMIFHKYPVHFFIVVLCILFSSITTVIGSYFTGNILIDVFLTPSIYQIDTNTNQPIMVLMDQFLKTIRKLSLKASAS